MKRNLDEEENEEMFKTRLNDEEDDEDEEDEENEENEKMLKPKLSEEEIVKVYKSKLSEEEIVKVFKSKLIEIKKDVEVALNEVQSVNYVEKIDSSVIDTNFIMFIMQFIATGKYAQRIEEDDYTLSPASYRESKLTEIQELDDKPFAYPNAMKQYTWCYLSGSTLLYLYGNKMFVPSDIDIYMYVKRGHDLKSEYHLKYRFDVVVLKRQYNYSKPGIAGISSIVKYKVFINNQDTNFSIQLIYSYDPLKVVSSNDFDILRNHVPLDLFEDISEAKSFFKENKAGNKLEYLPQPSYFGRYYDSTYLLPEKYYRIVKYLRYGFEIKYKGELMNLNNIRKLTDSVPRNDPIIALKAQIFTLLCELYYLNKSDIVDEFRNQIITLKNEFEATNNETPLKSKVYLSEKDTMKNYKKALISDSRKLTLMEKNYNFFSSYIWSSVNDMLGEIFNSKLKSSGEKSLARLNYINTSKYQPTCLPDSVSYIDYSLRVETPNYEKVFDIIHKAMNNKNVYITGGTAQHMINNRLKIKDIDIYFHEEENFTIPYKLFGMYSACTITRPKNKSIAYVKTFYFLHRGRVNNHKILADETNPVKLFASKNKSGIWYGRCLTIQLIATTKSPIDVINDFDFEVSKAFYKIENGKFIDYTLHVRKEMILTGITGYNVLDFNTFTFNEMTYLNKDASTRLFRYFIKGYKILKNEIVKKCDYSFLEDDSNPLTLEEIVTMVWYSYNDGGKNAYYTEENIKNVEDDDDEIELGYERRGHVQHQLANIVYDLGY